MEYKESGNRFFKEQKWAQAVEEYSKGLADSSLPADTRGLLLSNRSQCRLNLEEWDLAFEDADACLKLLPEHTKSIFRRGTAHEKLGRRNEALMDFARVVKAEPQNTAAIKSAQRLREEVMKQRERSTDEALPANILESLREEGDLTDVQSVDRRVEACQKLRALCVHKGLTGAVLSAGALDILLRRASSSETPPQLREALLAVLVAMASGHEAQDSSEDYEFRPPPRTDTPLAVPPAAAEVRKRLHSTLPVAELRQVCRSHAQSLRYLAILLSFTHELEDADALEAVHDALSFVEGGEVDVPRAGVTSLTCMCDRRRRLGKQGKLVSASGKLLKCLESALSTTSCAEQLKCLMASIFTLLADDDRPKGEEIDLPEVGLKILEPFLQNSDWGLRANGLGGLTALLAASTKVAAQILTKSQVPFMAILHAIQKPPPGPEGRAAQNNAVEVLLLATGDQKTRQSVIEGGGIDILLAALGDGQEGSRGLMHAKLVAVLATLAGHKKDVREEIFDRIDFLMELRHALDAARESASAARGEGKAGPNLDEVRRLFRALYESCACLTIHGEFKESLLASKKTLKSMQDLLTAQDLVEDPQLAFFYSSIAYNLCRSREDKVRPKSNQFPFNELDDSDLNAIEEFYEKMPAESRPVKNGEVDAGSQELADKLRAWCVLQSGDTVRRATDAPASSASANLIAHLGKCTAHGSPRVKNLVALVLKFLCMEHGHRRFIVSSGGVRTLLGLVDLEEEVARDAARQALAQICIVTNPTLLSYSEQLDSVRPLVQMLEHRHELQQFEGAMGLTNLLSCSEELRSRAIQGDAWRASRDLLFSENEQVQRAGIEAMCNLTMAPEILERFAEGKYEMEIRVFISFCHSSDRPTVLAASGALAMLASCDEVAVHVAKHEKLGGLLDALSESSDADVQHRIVSCLCNLAAAEGCPPEAASKIKRALKDKRGKGLRSPEAEKILRSCLGG